MNFTYKAMEQRAQHLRDLLLSIDELKRSSPDKSLEDTKASEIIKEMVPTFKSHMDNDLDVLSAFESLEDAILELGHLQDQGKMGKRNIEDLISSIAQINEVLKVL